MADLRLTGRKVAAVRSMLSVPGVASAMWSVLSRDFRIPELRALPPSSRSPLDPAPVPVQARQDPGWPSSEQSEPEPRTGSGAALRAAFAQGLSPLSVLERVLAAHDAADERSPFIAVDADRAHEAAQASQIRWRDGRTRGPLDGLIVPIKDEFDMVGLPTLGGTTYTDEIRTEDAWMVQRLQDAGAIVLGKTHATEWGLNPLGVLEHHTGPRNVYDSERAPGGSSTGSGVAVGLGWCPSAVGTDGGGSIRIPAALNGVFGIKPTYIRIGRTGDRWGASSVAHIGPIGRSTRDLVEQLAATAGIDPNDPLTRWAPDAHASAPWFAALSRGIRGARIGVVTGELADADPAIATAVSEALAALEADGAVLVDVDIPLASLVNGIGALCIGSETAANVSDLLEQHPKGFGHELAILLRMMDQVSAQDLLMAARNRAMLRRQSAAALADVHLLALPTLARTAAPYAQSEDRTAILDSAATAAMTRFNFLGNLTGLPAGTVPIGLSDGLPMGLQLVGDAWDEASVFAGMAHCERLGLCDLTAPASGLDVLG